jgi:hypothetical protein
MRWHYASDALRVRRIEIWRSVPFPLRSDRDAALETSRLDQEWLDRG